MTHASLFSGIGGFDLAAEWMGWHNAFHCEINEFCTKILNYHFQDAEHYTDITRTDFSKWRGRIDVLSGGFPCQPFSLAGKRKGSDDNRYLWPQMLRAIGDDGLSGRLDGITFSKWRQESVKAYGNAIVPQVAYEIFKAIELCR